MKTGIAFLLLFNTILLGQRIKDIATVAGVRTLHLKGFGIVAGLGGTGDSDKNLILHKKMTDILHEFWDNSNNPNAQSTSPITTRNLSLVLITANVPSYTKPGQPFTVEVSSIGDAKDLTDGQLLESALRGPTIPTEKNGEVKLEFTNYAVAQGHVIVSPTSKVKTTGTCTAILEHSFPIPFHTNYNTKYEYITLLLNQPDFNTSSNIASAINSYMNYIFKKDLSRGSGSSSGNNNSNIEPSISIAKAIDSGSVQVRILPRYLRNDSSHDLVGFISMILNQVELTKDDIDREAKVIINRKDNSIVVNGEVHVRPFSAMLDGQFIQIPNPKLKKIRAGNSIPRKTIIQEQNDFRLVNIIAQFQKMKIPSADTIKILKGMAKAGVLEGKIEEE